MTRPKVPDDKRIRTAQACESCKRRKQKCNGLKPCNTCTKRNLICDYIPHHSNPHASAQQPPGDLIASSVKRSHTSDTLISEDDTVSEPKRAKPSQDDRQTSARKEASSINLSEATEPSHLLPVQPPTTTQPSGDHDFETRSRNSTISGADEVAEIFTETRMLQDPTGRLLYLGDSATLSYLQFIRMLVESMDGPSQFTMDPSRHRLMEATTSLPPDVRAPALLPDRETANILIDSYFTNTNGLVEIFDREAFTRQMELCYLDPLTAQSSFLCLLYLVLAIGLVLATPKVGTNEEDVVRKLQTGQVDRAELFYRSAKCLGDPTTGFEDADFWSVQALLLMSVYMLARTKRNAAYAYHGMAVRSAYALGLHRQETMVVFPLLDRAERRNAWRSLYVLDRFLAAALGRPTSISEEDCSTDALVSPEKDMPEAEADPSSTGGLTAAVRSCQVIGIILKKIYARRMTSTKLAQEIADQCKGGPQKCHPGLHWRQATNNAISPGHGIAILHVNLLYCHAVILLTRPFFLFQMNKIQQEKSGVSRGPPPGSRMNKFSEACVSAAYHTITLVQMGYEGGYLPQRNPFIIHFLFAAALVVLSSEFACLHKQPAYSTCINQAITIMKYCSETDPQAMRLVYILTTFYNVIASKMPRPTQDDRSPVPATPTTAAVSSTYDPVANFFLSHTHSQPHSASNLSTTLVPPNLSRRNSSALSVVSPPQGGMPSSMTPPSASASADPQDAECFSFDTLWENFPATAAAGTVLGGAPGVASGQMPMLHTYGAAPPDFVAPPIPMNNGAGSSGLNSSASNVPLYHMMKFG